MLQKTIYCICIPVYMYVNIFYNVLLSILYIQDIQIKMSFISPKMNIIDIKLP